MAEQVLLSDQVFNDRRSGGRSSQPAFGHRAAKLFVVDTFTSGFHRRQQRTIVVTSWRLSLFGAKFDLAVSGRFTIDDCDQFVFVSCSADRSTVDGQVTRHDQNSSVGAEGVLLVTSDSSSDFEFGMRVENCQKTSQNVVI